MTSNYIFFLKIPELENTNVRIKNLNHVEKVISNLIRGGKLRLQVISDFDRTISLHSFEGKPCLTSNCKIRFLKFFRIFFLIYLLCL